jgi:uncharacterized protein (TIGR02300 family)
VGADKHLRQDSDEGFFVAREKLGTKRVCPETGRKFYDLNKDPVVSPYTGASYPLSYFEGEKEKGIPMAKVEEEVVEPDAPEVEAEVEVAEGAEIVSLEEADAEAGGDDIPEIEDTEADTELGTEEDTFLEEEEEDDEDIGIVVGVDDDDD